MRRCGRPSLSRWTRLSTISAATIPFYPRSTHQWRKRSSNLPISSYNFEVENYQVALKHFQIALDACLKVLGVDHPMTGQIYLDIANVFLKMERREEAIRFLEKAFEIFDTSKHVFQIQSLLLPRRRVQRKHPWPTKSPSSFTTSDLTKRRSTSP